jgi:DNA-binding PadR family transcriptional regulator
MTEVKRDLEQFLPLTPAAFHILLALAGEEKHGYAIMQEVEQISDGQVNIGPGTLYGTIKRLSNDDLIVESEERPDPEMDDQRRRYYQLTSLGRKVLRAEAQRLARLVTQARTRHVLGQQAPS